MKTDRKELHSLTSVQRPQGLSSALELLCEAIVRPHFPRVPAILQQDDLCLLQLSSSYAFPPENREQELHKLLFLECWFSKGVSKPASSFELAEQSDFGPPQIYTSDTWDGVP